MGNEVFVYPGKLITKYINVYFKQVSHIFYVFFFVFFFSMLSSLLMHIETTDKRVEIERAGKKSEDGKPK